MVEDKKVTPQIIEKGDRNKPLTDPQQATNKEKLKVRNVDEITSIILRSYFSFLWGVKSANNELFKDFYNEIKMEKNK